MVILTMRINDMAPFQLSNKIREKNETIPIFLLLYDNPPSAMYEKKPEGDKIEKIFVWNRD